MKRLFMLPVMLVLLGLIGTPVFATPVSVNFSALGISSEDITTSLYPADWTGYALDGVNFRYDDFGSGVDFAMVDASGVWGTTGGSLIFGFDVPVAQLNFGFSLLGLSAPVEDALVLIASGDSGMTDLFADALVNDGNGDASGSLSYSGDPIDSVQMFFDFNAPFFSVSGLAYDTEPASVPEPAAAAVILPLLGWLGWRLKARTK